MVLAYFIGQRKTDGYRPDTLITDQKVIGNFALFVGQDTPVSEISPEHVEGYMARLREHKAETGRNRGQPLSIFTIVKIIKTLRAFGKWMERQGFGNPFGEIRRPKDVRKKVIPFLPQDDLQAILDLVNENTANGSRNKAIICLMADTGVRVTEAISIQVQDLHLEENEVIILYGKGNKERIVPFGNTTKELLMRYIHVFRPPASTQHLFLSIDGFPLTRGSVELIFARLRRRAGVERFYPHLLRHSFAQWYLTGDDDAGITPGDPETLARIMGHETFATTKKYLEGITIKAVKKVYSTRSPMDRILAGRSRRRFNRRGK